jgi:cellulose synthase/poly-beta-1,6-N-acetylglucosamine synthase-like glycosyltransferase
VWVVVPARDEGAGLANALASLTAQTVRPDGVVVVVNNSTDDTEAVARAYASRPGSRVTVLVMPGHNRFRKAGALNEGITHLLGPDGRLPGRVRLLVTMDGDSVLDRHFVATASRVLSRDPRLGAVSAACQAKSARGAPPAARLLMHFQRIEYGRAAFARVLPSVHSMSGAGSVYRAAALNGLLGSRRHVFDQRETNLVEDYETTLALRARGWRVTANPGCVAYTEVMPTVPMLVAQRIRWARGTIDEWRRYGYTHRVVRRSLAFALAGSAAAVYLWTLVGLAAAQAAVGHSPGPRYLALAVSWAVYQALSARSLGWRVAAFELVLLPGLAYSLLRNYWIARAVVASFARRPPSAWTKGG